MASFSQKNLNPDDDSWGKIASDLFGIQFNDGDDFELPDDDAPKKKTQPVAPVTSVPAETQPVEAIHQTNNPESETPAELTEPKKASVPGNEDHDEFWDILESWNWDESKKEAPAKPRRAEETRPNRARADSAPAEARRSQRNEPPRQEERRPQPSDRPPRREAEPITETTASGDEGDRESHGRRDESRRDRPPRTQQPQRPRKVEAERPATERSVAEQKSERPPERHRTREAASAFVGDDFGSGVDEPVESPRSKQVPPPRRREEPPRPPRKPAPPKRTEPVDEFEGDLFVDDEGVTEEDSFVGDAVTNEEPGSDDGESGRPRRRRRRRRRGRGRTAADISSTDESEFEGGSDDEFSEADSSTSDIESDEASAETEDADEDHDSDEERSPRRPRRRRRRRGRRPEAPASAEKTDEADDSDAAFGDDEGESDEELIYEEDVEDSDDEVVIPVSYEGIPTWEEAISYLVITPPTESRGHHRGRGDNRRR